MNGTVAETAVIGLIAGNVTWPLLLGALFLTRIWKVSTATKPAKAQQAPPESVAATEAKPLREAGTEAA